MTSVTVYQHIYIDIYGGNLYVWKQYRSGSNNQKRAFVHLQRGLQLGLALGQHVPLSLHDAHGCNDDYKDENVRMILMLFASLLIHDIDAFCCGGYEDETDLYRRE